MPAPITATSAPVATNLPYPHSERFDLSNDRTTLVEAAGQIAADYERFGRRLGASDPRSAQADGTRVV
jgi:hypothetical protein